MKRDGINASEVIEIVVRGNTQTNPYKDMEKDGSLQNYTNNMINNKTDMFIIEIMHEFCVSRATAKNAINSYLRSHGKQNS